VDWVRELLDLGEEADPDELLEAVEEWGRFHHYLQDAAQEDREAVLALAREVFVLAEAEEWPLFVEALARLAQSDPAAAMALVDEVMARAEELRALGVRLKSREAFLEQVGLSS
jgi:hypothetical protein